MPFNARSFASLARSAVRLLRQASSSAGAAESSRKTGRPAQPRTPAARRTPSPSPGARPAPPRSAASRHSPSSAGRTSPAAPASAASAAPSGRKGYAGDYRGPVSPVYAPQPDGDPDPGEVVWAWVPYEDDPTQGKDRPVLLIGRSGNLLLALMMTSRDRNNRNASDPRYLDVGTGPWDSKGRPSEVRLDRVLQLETGSVRREGAIMDRNVFQTVARRLAVMRPAH